MPDNPDEELVVEEVTEVIDFDDDEEREVDLKMTLTLTFLQNPDEFDIEGTDDEQIAQLCKGMAENFVENPDDLIGLLEDYTGSYNVKIEPTPEGEV